MVALSEGELSWLPSEKRALRGAVEQAVTRRAPEGAGNFKCCVDTLTMHHYGAIYGKEETSIVIKTTYSKLYKTFRSGLIDSLNQGDIPIMSPRPDEVYPTLARDVRAPRR